MVYLYWRLPTPATGPCPGEVTCEQLLAGVPDAHVVPGGITDDAKAHDLPIFRICVFVRGRNVSDHRRAWLTHVALCATLPTMA